MALVVEPGLTITGDASTYSDISADSRRFIWIEGSFDGSNNESGILWTSTRYSVLRKVTISNAAGTATLSDAGLKLSISRFNIIENVTTRDGMQIGFMLSSSHYNRIKKLTSIHNRDRGIVFNNSGYNRLLETKSVQNWGLGAYLYSTNSIYNKFDGLLVADNAGGFHNFSPGNNILTGVVAAGNADTGVSTLYPWSSFLTNITAVNNGNEGIEISKGAGPVVHYNFLYNSLSVNNNIGVFLDRLDDTSVRNVVTVSNTTYGISSDQSNEGLYSGVLIFGGNGTSDCFENAGTNPGIDGACTSAAAATLGQSLASTFLGKVTTDDVSNDSDSNGQATYPTDIAAFDWVDFEYFFRVWGVDHADVFPTVNHRGNFGCTGATQIDSTGDTSGECTGTWNNTGRIWDWSVAGSDAVVRDVLTLPTGNDFLTHTWSDSSTTQYLENSVEIMFDHIGNDNILCETGETCLFTPNIGAYQGHGPLMSAGTFTDGTLTGITLMRYKVNGR